MYRYALMYVNYVCSCFTVVFIVGDKKSTTSMICLPVFLWFLHWYWGSRMIGAILWLPQCQWNNPEGCWLNQQISNKDKTRQSANCYRMLYYGCGIRLFSVESIGLSSKRKVLLGIYQTRADRNGAKLSDFQVTPQTTWYWKFYKPRHFCFFRPIGLMDSAHRDLILYISIWTFNHHCKATFTHARGGCGAEAGGFWHSRSATAGMFTHTRSGRGRICHFLRTMMVWSARFRSGRGKLGVGPISCGADFAPAPPPLRDRACVNTCNDLCWSQLSARLRPRQPAHVWTYLF